MYRIIILTFIFNYLLEPLTDDDLEEEELELLEEDDEGV